MIWIWIRSSQHETNLVLNERWNDLHFKCLYYDELKVRLIKTGFTNTAFLTNQQIILIKTQDFFIVFYYMDKISIYVFS